MRYPSFQIEFHVKQEHVLSELTIPLVVLRFDRYGVENDLVDSYKSVKQIDEHLSHFAQPDTIVLETTKADTSTKVKESLIENSDKVRWRSCSEAKQLANKAKDGSRPDGPLPISPLWLYPEYGHLRDRWSVFAFDHLLSFVVS